MATRKKPSESQKELDAQTPVLGDDEMKEIIMLLRSPAVQKYLQSVLAEFPQFDAKADNTMEKTTLMLLHRNAAEQFLEKIYSKAKLQRPRIPLIPRQLIRN